MATLEESVHSDLSAYQKEQAPVSNPIVPSAFGPQEPSLNPVLRCPLPPIFQAAPDSLRQFYQGNRVPQTRLLSPVSYSANTSTSTITTTVIESSAGSSNSTPGNNPGSSSGSSNSTANTATRAGGLGSIQQASVTTSVLGPGARFTGVIQLGKCFQLIRATANNGCRIQLYGSALAQTSDASRMLDVPPPAGTAQGIISDIALDTAPFLWTYQNRIGCNADEPQTTLAYITVTNLQPNSAAITVSFLYAA